MSIISLRVSDDEKIILEKASALYGGGVSSMIKKIVFEKLEEDYDLKVFDEYEKERQAGTLKTRSIDELWDEQGI